jgi:hypothetical protein
MGRFPLTPFNRIFQPSRHSNPAVFIPFHCIKTGPKPTEVNMASYHFSVKSKNKGYAIPLPLYCPIDAIRKRPQKK